MRKSTTSFLLAALVAAAMSATDLRAGVIPPVGLVPGTPYQLIFVTRGAMDATSSVIADYDAFVTTQAALSNSIPLGVTWNVVGTTSLVQAIDHAMSVPGLPIYNMHGELVAPGSQGLYGGTLANPIGYDQYGDAWDTLVWTGKTQFSGNLALGAANPAVGDSGATSLAWAYFGNAGTGSFDRAFYALSTQIPEPCSLTLVASALAGGLLCWGRIHQPRICG